MDSGLRRNDISKTISHKKTNAERCPLVFHAITLSLHSRRFLVRYSSASFQPSGVRCCCGVKRDL